jgi:tetratricopeptide (TPR) repeat protein
MPTEAGAGGPRASEGTTALEAPEVPPDGRALVHTGNLPAAEAAFREAIERSPNDAGLRHNLAVALARQKKLPEAVSQFREALRLKPGAAETHRNLALALSQQGRQQDAEKEWREAVRLDPALASARHELGNALRNSQQLDEALVHLREAVRLRREIAETHHDLGLALAELGRPREAMECYETALRLRPEFPEALNNLGILLEDRGEHAVAETHYRAALRLRPGSADTHNNLGVALAAARRHEEAIDCYRAALLLNPQSPLALNNLGNALRTLGSVDEAITCLGQALELRPDYAEAHNNLGICLMQLGRRDEALRCYEQALHLRPHYPEAHLNRSLAWLGDADFPRGWTEYEWRWCGKEVKRRTYSKPLWAGARIPDATLFLYFEQGLGDTLQFIRYVEIARRRAGRIIVEVQPSLVPLLSRCRGIDELVASPVGPRRFDFHLPLMSLPGALGTRLDSIPADTPYIFADAERASAWRQRLEPLTGYRVGIGWQGNTQYRGDRQRSIPLENFARLAEVPGVRLISLQKGDGTGQIAAFEERVRTLAPRPAPSGRGTGGSGEPAITERDAGYSTSETDPASRPLEAGRDAALLQFDNLDGAGGAFMDTAAILEQIDLVITSDTALAHLAGAMGVETWVALPYAADWRWFRDRVDSPWYPTVRLFRQDRPGGWSDVFERIAGELAARAAKVAVGAKPQATAIAKFEEGTRLAKRGENVLAEQALRDAVAIQHDYAEAHHNLGVVLARSGRHREAVAAFRRALEIDRNYSEAAGNLGLAYLELEEPESAASVLRGAVGSGRATPDDYNHLGVALSRIGRPAEAVEALHAALRLRPDFAAAHVNLAQAYTALGRFDEAFLEREWRWSLGNPGSPRPKRRRWAGEPIGGRTILVYADEPLSSVLEHIRYVDALRDKRCRVVLACRPEVAADLAKRDGMPCVVPLNESLPEHDLHARLLSLPWLLRNSR